ncbi:MAG TPA: hypothetical protein VGO50_19935 [Pyrinomonadaceae bacterium]|jgi:hypothetical protein|nr:hypothetical protein [Pyrinomonadaceae bacterium]
MDKVELKLELQLESLKMVKEWVTWLMGLQVSICALLWSPLKDNPIMAAKSGAGLWLHIGWFAFLVSLLLTVLVYRTLPKLIEELAKDETLEESIFSRDLKWAEQKISLGTMLTVIYWLFFAGIAFTGLFVLIRAF